MMIKKTFRYRLKPNRKDRELFSSFAGSCRWLYNFALHAKKLAYEDLGLTLSCYDLNNLLPILKREEQTHWLKDVHSQILQQSLSDLNLAYEHFFRRVKLGEKAGYPKFKRKGSGDSFRYPQGVKIKGAQVYLPKIGWVRFRKSREIQGAIKQTTVIQEAGHWYVCFSCDMEKEEAPLHLQEESVVGIDMGLFNFATLASGPHDHFSEVENPRFLKKKLKKLRFLSRNLSKKVFKSSNWYKAKRKLQIFQARLKNSRKDFAHQLSTQLVKNHDIVGVESLSIQSLLQKSVSSLARSMADAAWRQFLGFLQYKLEYAGKLLVQADRWYASTKTCSRCGSKVQMELSDRLFSCTCGHVQGRDRNAAVNIKNLALKRYKAAGTTV